MVVDGGDEVIPGLLRLVFGRRACHVDLEAKVGVRRLLAELGDSLSLHGKLHVGSAVPGRPVSSRALRVNRRALLVLDLHAGVVQECLRLVHHAPDVTLPVGSGAHVIHVRLARGGQGVGGKRLLHPAYPGLKGLDEGNG